MSESETSLLGGRYRLIRSIGRGGMGEVWLAQDELLDRPVAVKRLLTGSSGPSEPAGPDELSKLLREARLAARLNHPNAVAVFDVVVSAGRPDVVMEYVPGDTLADKIKRRGRIPVDEVRRIGAAVADALAEAHRLGIVHRDLKPANVLVTDRGVPKLADFGIARLGGESGAGNTVTGFMLGTPAYLAPEVARGGNADAASDVWSLGITLYAALDGHSPFQTGSGDNTLAVLSRVVTSSAPPPEHGGDLTPAIMRMIAGDPAARPQAHEAAALLRAPVAAGEWPAAAASAGSATLPGTAGQSHLQTPGAYPSQPQTAPDAYRQAQQVASGPQPVHPHTPNPYVAPPPQAYPPPPHQTGPYGSYPPPWQAPPSKPIKHGSGGGRNKRYALIGVAALVLLGAIIGIVLAVSSGDDAPRASGSSASTRPTSSPSTLPRSTSLSTMGSAPASTPANTGSPSLEYDEQIYRAPGGIAVAAPSSWTPDASAGIANVRDFRAPGATDLRVGSFFRVGIGNDKPAANIHDEVTGTVNSLKSSSGAYKDLKIAKTTYVPSYQGTEAADVEFTGTNSQGVQRHVKVRLWIAHGHTLEIELNSPTNLYSLYADDLFPRLVDSCVVSS